MFGRLTAKALTEKYKIDKKQKLGRGAFGEVYVGYEKGLFGEKVAVKKICMRRMFGNPEKVRQEKAILEKCTQINHPNLIRILDYAEDIDEEGLGFIYIVMEFCEGGTLKELIDKKQEARERFSEDEALEIGRQVFSGLMALHGYALKITHRDIKPDNIMLKKGVWKICDFGLSIDKLRHSTFGGTPLYMAPEYFNNRGGRDEKVDIWSFGMIMHELIFRNLPIPEGAPDLGAEIVQLDYQVPDEPEVSQHYRDLLLCCLSPESENRNPSLIWNRLRRRLSPPLTVKSIIQATFDNPDRANLPIIEFEEDLSFNFCHLTTAEMLI